MNILLSFSFLCISFNLVSKIYWFIKINHCSCPYLSQTCLQAWPSKLSPYLPWRVGRRASTSKTWLSSQLFPSFLPTLGEDLQFAASLVLKTQKHLLMGYRGNLSLAQEPSYCFYFHQDHPWKQIVQWVWLYSHRWNGWLFFAVVWLQQCSLLCIWGIDCWGQDCGDATLRFLQQS